MAKPTTVIDVFEYIYPNNEMNAICYVNKAGQLMHQTIEELNEITGGYIYSANEKEALELPPEVIAIDFQYSPIKFKE